MLHMLVISDHISHEELKRQLDYDPETGWLTWKIRKSRIYPGRRAGSQHVKGHREITVAGQSFREHRVIYFWMTGEDLGDYIDHKDRVRNHNQWDNLRPATHAQNYVNSLTFGEMRGISVRKMKNCIKYRVRGSLSQGGGRRNLGTYDTLEEAKSVRDHNEKTVWGEFACQR